MARRAVSFLGIREDCEPANLSCGKLVLTALIFVPIESGIAAQHHSFKGRKCCRDPLYGDTFSAERILKESLVAGIALKPWPLMLHMSDSSREGR